MSFSEWFISCTDGQTMALLFYTTFIFVGLAQYIIFHAEVFKKDSCQLLANVCAGSTG